MIELSIESVQPSKSGKSNVVKAGGKFYLCKPDQPIKAGTRIIAETTDSTYNGQTNTWINKFSVVSSQEQPKAPANVASTGGNGAPYWQPMVSNVVAAAINAGLIKEPQDISAWVFATRQALALEKMDEMDSDLPF